MNTAIGTSTSVKAHVANKLNLSQDLQKAKPKHSDGPHHRHCSQRCVALHPSPNMLCIWIGISNVGPGSPKAQKRATWITYDHMAAEFAGSKNQLSATWFGLTMTSLRSLG